MCRWKKKTFQGPYWDFKYIAETLEHVTITYECNFRQNGAGILRK